MRQEHEKAEKNAADTLHSATTHNLFLIDVPRAVGGGERGGAGLAVPGDVAALRGAADGQRVNTVGVAVAVAAVLLPSSVPRGPNEYGAQSATTLRSRVHTLREHIKRLNSHPFLILTAETD